MAWQVSKRVWDNTKTIDQNDKLMLLALAEQARDEDGVCYPSYDTLAEMINVTRRSAIRIIERLEEWGHIYINEHAVGRRNTNVYFVTSGLTHQEIVEALVRRFKKSEEDAALCATVLLSKQASQIKGDTGDTKKTVKGDTGDTFYNEGEKKKVTLVAEKGDTGGRKGDTGGRKGDMAVSPEPCEPCEPLIEPLGSAPQPEPKLKEPKAKKPSKKGGKPPPPPAVEVFREIARRYPHQALWSDIDTTVGQSPVALETWGSVVKGYIACGWNPQNVSGMLDYFKRGEIPQSKSQKNGVNNGHNSQHNRSLQRTGRELSQKPYYDPNTREYVYPDGRRVKA